MEYRLHQDLNNLVQFFLSETWESKKAHQAQFEKPDIQKLAPQLEALRAKPYQVIFRRSFKSIVLAVRKRPQVL